MGISSSIESSRRKSLSSKSRSPEPDVAKSADQPNHTEMIIAVWPPTTSSTPSSPNRNLSPPRIRSHSFHDSRPTSAKENPNVGDSDSYVVDNRQNNGGESIGFSLAEPGTNCNADHQRRQDEQHLPDDARICTSRDCDDVTAIATETHDTDATKFNQEAEVIDDLPHSRSGSTEMSTISESSSGSQQPNTQTNSAEGTRKKAAPKLAEIRTRRSSEAITDIAQAKKLSSRIVFAQKEKKTNAASNDKVVQRRPQNEQPDAATAPSPNNATGDEMPKRSPSAKSVTATKNQQSTGRTHNSKGSSAKQRLSLEGEQLYKSTTDSQRINTEKRHVTAARSSSDSKEASTQQRDGKPAANSEHPEPKMKSVVQNKPGVEAAHQPTGKENQKSTSTTSRKKKTKQHQPATTVNATTAADDEDDEYDWMNLITSLRDPDDIRNRKVEPKKGSSYKWAPKKSKGTKDEKDQTVEDEEEDEEDEEKELSDDGDCSRFRIY